MKTELEIVDSLSEARDGMGLNICAAQRVAT
jgi:hypothetical protein